VLMYERVRWNWKKIIADGATFFLFTACTGWIIVGYEWYLCDLALERVFWLRMMSGTPRVFLGPLCGMIKDAANKRLFGGASGFWRDAAAGTTALFVFQLPFYIASALIMRVGIRQVVITCALYIANDILFGWLYVSILDQMRARFRVRAERDQ
jgi:hypothetical protein